MVGIIVPRAAAETWPRPAARAIRL